MALANWNDGTSTGRGNQSPITQFYEQDRMVVLKQKNAASTGLLNFNFRNEDITVFAAKDNKGTVLPLVALPCPPWYHDDRPEASPGNIITGN